MLEIFRDTPFENSHFEPHKIGSLYVYLDVAPFPIFFLCFQVPAVSFRGVSQRTWSWYQKKSRNRRKETHQLEIFLDMMLCP